MNAPYNTFLFMLLLVGHSIGVFAVVDQFYRQVSPHNKIVGRKTVIDRLSKDPLDLSNLSVQELKNMFMAKVIKDPSTQALLVLAPQFRSHYETMSLSKTPITLGQLAFLLQKVGRTLKVLNLSFTGITDEHLQIIRYYCSQLISIDLSFCEQITYEGICQLAHISSLRCFNLNGCTQVIDGGLSVFQQERERIARERSYGEIPLPYVDAMWKKFRCSDDGLVRGVDEVIQATKAPDCAICFESLGEGLITVFDCDENCKIKHVFHSKCIKSVTQCPLCRKNKKVLVLHEESFAEKKFMNVQQKLLSEGITLAE